MNYKLLKPFKYGSETITEIDIKEDYDLGDFSRIVNAQDKGKGDLIVDMVSIGTGFPIPKAVKISPVDGLKIVGMVNNFLGVGDILENS